MLKESSILRQLASPTWEFIKKKNKKFIEKLFVKDDSDEFSFLSAVENKLKMQKSSESRCKH